MVVGLPLSLAAATPSRRARRARSPQRLPRRLGDGVPVELHDERLTTRLAQRDPRRRRAPARTRAPPRTCWRAGSPRERVRVLSSLSAATDHDLGANAPPPNASVTVSSASSGAPRRSSAPASSPRRAEASPAARCRQRRAAPPPAQAPRRSSCRRRPRSAAAGRVLPPAEQPRPVEEPPTAEQPLLVEAPVDAEPLVAGRALRPAEPPVQADRRYRLRHRCRLSSRSSRSRSRPGARTGRAAAGGATVLACAIATVSWGTRGLCENSRERSNALAGGAVVSAARAAGRDRGGRAASARTQQQDRSAGRADRDQGSDPRGQDAHADRADRDGGGADRQLHGCFAASPVLHPPTYGAPKGTPTSKASCSRRPMTWTPARRPAARGRAADRLPRELRLQRGRPARHALHITPYQLLIVASMVEREAQIPGDRAKIAAVIYNRLARGMPLGIDASSTTRSSSKAALRRTRTNSPKRSCTSTRRTTRARTWACRRHRSRTRAWPRSKRPPILPTPPICTTSPARTAVASWCSRTRSPNSKPTLPRTKRPSRTTADARRPASIPRRAQASDAAARRPRLAGRAQSLAGDPQRRARGASDGRLALPAAAGAAGAVRGDGARSAGPRAFSARTSRSLTSRRRSRWPTECRPRRARSAPPTR